MTKTEKALRKTRGFTRIELLVVAVIVTILAGMFIPALAVTKEEADQETCLANLKQIGQAYIMYLHDYNDFFPPVGDGSCTWGLYSDGREVTLPRLLKNYIPGDVNNIADWPAKDGMSVVWRCPSIGTPGRYYTTHPYWYYANPFLTSTPGTMPTTPPGLWGFGCTAVTKLSEVTRPHDKVFVVTDLIPYIHNEMTNAVFLDGHAEAIKGDFLWYMPEYGAPK